MKKTTENPPGTTEPEACPAPGMLSAFIEGHLSQENRKLIFSHLRQCGKCCLVVADSVKLLRDLPESIRESEIIYTPSEPLTNPPKRRVPVLMRRFGKFQNAALVSPIAAIFLFTVLFQSGPEWGSDEVFDALKGVSDFAEISRSLPVEEYKPLTLGFNRGLSDQKLAFKTGGLLGRLEISRIAGDSEKSQFYSDKLVSLLNRSDFTNNLNQKTEPDLQLQIDQIEEHFLNSDVDFYFKLGLFVESGKAYSLVNRSELFDKNYLKALINHPQFDSLPPGVSRRFKEIESLLFKNSVAQNNEIIYKLLQDIQQILS
jgi:hypothetical protein